MVVNIFGFKDLLVFINIEVNYIVCYVICDEK